jgi:threonine aldolase
LNVLQRSGSALKFYSDNTATICPEILDAIVEANREPTLAYGEDRWTQRLDEVFSNFFQIEVRAYAVATGTSANALSVASIAPPYGAVFAHEQAHALRDECGAPEFFSGGAKLVPVAGAHAKITRGALIEALEANPQSVHTIQPAALSLTQASELGTVYGADEIAALSEIAHRHALKVHMDGARFANALTFLRCTPGDLTWRVGVDVLSFGATKNGALAAEAVIFFDRQSAKDFELRRKRAGHLISKSRYVSAQLLAYVDSGVWRRNAQRANALAGQLAGPAGAFLLHPVESNQVFLRLGEEHKQALRDAGFGFYDWGAVGSGAARFVVSWDQPEQDITQLCAALASLARHGHT